MLRRIRTTWKGRSCRPIKFGLDEKQILYNRTVKRFSKAALYYTITTELSSPNSLRRYLSAFQSFCQRSPSRR